jgi:hypothetical protein
VQYSHRHEHCVQEQDGMLGNTSRENLNYEELVRGLKDAPNANTIVPRHSRQLFSTHRSTALLFNQKPRFQSTCITPLSLTIFLGTFLRSSISPCDPQQVFNVGRLRYFFEAFLEAPVFPPVFAGLSQTVAVPSFFGLRG